MSTTTPRREASSRVQVPEGVEANAVRSLRCCPTRSWRGANSSLASRGVGTSLYSAAGVSRARSSSFRSPATPLHGPCQDTTRFSAGIAARVFNENAQGGLGEIPFVHAWPEVWVENEGDEVRALELIHGFEKTSDGQRQVGCPACGESNPENFEVCWNCGTTLAG